MIPFLSQLFLKTKDEIYGYNSNFSQKFSILFCTKCNSAYDRLKLTKGTVSTNPKDSETVDIEEFKFKLIVKKKNGSLLPAKWLTIHEKEFEGFLSSLEASVQGLLDNSSISNEDFNIAYKQLNSNGPGTHLEDENDFKEFVNEYSNIISHKRSVTIHIAIKEVISKKKRKDDGKKVIFI